MDVRKWTKMTNSIHGAGALDLEIPPAGLAEAFALETIKTGTPAAQPDIGEGTKQYKSKEQRK